MKLLYYASSSYGGLLNYAQDQANALGELGIEVTVLCSPRFVKRPGDRYALLPDLIDNRPRGPRNRLARSLRFAWISLRNAAILCKAIKAGGHDRVLFVCYAEYFAPLWAGKFQKLARNGVRFGAIIQEAVRDFKVGPTWWHNWSVGSAYSFLKYAFVHDDIDLDTATPVPGLETIVVPMAPHPFPDPTETREQTRQRLGIPDSSVVLFAFGHIRDNKNLDYAIHALKAAPGTHLLVAGARNAASQKPESYYMELAESLGVADRCTWLIEYISEQEAANLFTASDLALLTYNSSFRSASGVLNVAARYRKPCIASAGQGSLQKVVKSYGLGVWVEPDDPEAMAQGVKQWMSDPPVPRWEDYNRDNSWQRNARLVAEAFQLFPADPSAK
jgi:glycosyltransferase involved in cell wall biosynthesis